MCVCVCVCVCASEQDGTIIHVKDARLQSSTGHAHPVYCNNLKHTKSVDIKCNTTHTRTNTNMHTHSTGPAGGLQQTQHTHARTHTCTHTALGLQGACNKHNAHTRTITHMHTHSTGPAGGLQQTQHTHARTHTCTHTQHWACRGPAQTQKVRGGSAAKRSAKVHAGGIWSQKNANTHTKRWTAKNCFTSMRSEEAARPRSASAQVHVSGMCVCVCVCMCVCARMCALKRLPSDNKCD